MNKLFKRYALFILLIAAIPLMAQDMKSKKEKDANGNIILEEGYYMDSDSVMVGSVKKIFQYDDKNRKLEEQTYFWDKKTKSWYNTHQDIYEYTDISKTLTNYTWVNGKRRPSYKDTKIEDKVAKYKENTRRNWDTISNEWSKTMNDKDYYLNDSLAIVEAYTRNWDTNEYFGVRREVRLRGKQAYNRGMLMKDKWDKDEQKWIHNARYTSWNVQNTPSYNMTERYNREKKRWVPDMKVESLDDKNQTLYIWTDGKWLKHKRTRKETSPQDEERINLYIWDRQSGKWEKHMSRMSQTIQGTEIYVYYTWDKDTAMWQPKQRSHEFNISVGQQYNSETKEWKALDRDTMIRFDEKFSFDISDWNDIDIILRPIISDYQSE